jgi:hypothetical protein
MILYLSDDGRSIPPASQSDGWTARLIRMFIAILRRVASPRRSGPASPTRSAM